MQLPHGFNKGAELKQCPTITGEAWRFNNLLKAPVAYDEQNGRVRTDGTVGALTTDGSTPKHNNRVIESKCPAEQGKNIQIAQGDLKNGIVDIDGKAYLIDKGKLYRVRKLTPRECWRLMDFTDEDFDRAQAAGVSNSQLYRQSGNSIVVSVLEAIFGQMLEKNTQTIAVIAAQKS